MSFRQSMSSDGQVTTSIGESERTTVNDDSNNDKGHSPAVSSSNHDQAKTEPGDETECDRENETVIERQAVTGASLTSTITTGPASGNSEHESVPVTDEPKDTTISAGNEENEAYSVFTTAQKRAIVLTGSFCAFFSPVTASIYYPALDIIAQDLHVTNTAANLTVTTYLILQGIAPMFVGAFSDSAGRRPAFAYCFIVYTIANIGLGAQNSYAALITLRCIQSAGSSGTVALSNGIAADVVTTAERGAYVAFASLGSLLGPTIGPVIGGLIAQFLGWHWIFWFLAILAGVFFVPLMLFLPETNRNVVGNGSYPPPLHCQSLTGITIAKNLKKKGVKLDVKRQEQLRRDYKVKFPNPLEALIIAWDKATFIILLGNGLVFAGLYAILTGISSLFSVIYDFNEIQIALCFLPFGAGSIISSMIVGRVIDWNYRRHAAKLGFTIVKNRKQNLENFPLERARLEVAFPMVYFGIATTITYGWILHFQTHLAGPLVVLFLTGVALTGVYQSLNLMMIDSYPDRAATATAANNLFRCLIGAGATAILGPLLNSWGPGWTYTFAALLWVLFSPALLVLMNYGPAWRKTRLEKAKVRTERKAKAQDEKRLQGTEV